MDRREAILQRLKEIAESLPDIEVVHRNKDNLSDKERPAIIILDADELSEAAADSRGRGPQIVTMTPEIYLLIAESAEQIGTELNAFRWEVLKAVLRDADLKSLTGQNGAISYEGCATGLARGRSLEGELGLSIAFSYPLIMAEF